MNQFYAKARQRFLLGQFNWLTMTVKAILVDSSYYSVNLNTHEYLADIPVAARIATSAAFTNKTAVDGAADAGDITFTAISGASLEYIVLYSDTGTESTSPLIAFIDTATGLPLTPNGGNIIIQWDAGPNKIFRI